MKTSRKGVSEAQLIVHGRASHAGLAPEKGINAIHELAAQITRIEKWNDLRRGITINADVVSGGSRANVVADRAEATLDLRAWRQADMRALEKRLHSLKPLHRGAKLELHGGFDRPPFERQSAPPSSPAPNPSPKRSAFPSAKPRPEAAPTAISPPPWASPPSTAWAQSATKYTPSTSTS